MTHSPVPPRTGLSAHSRTMSAMIRVHNPNTHEIVVDSAGHILSSRATTHVPAGDTVATRLVDAKRLTILPDPTPAEENPKPRKKSAPAAPAVAKDGE